MVQRKGQKNGIFSNQTIRNYNSFWGQSDFISAVRGQNEIFDE